MDSICKNVGKPYTIFFGLHLYRIFSDTYTLVSETVRRKMYELFLTWKQPLSNGSQLFDNVPMNKIESFLNHVQKSKSTTPVTQSPSLPNSQLASSSKTNETVDAGELSKNDASSSLNQSDLLKQIDKLLSLTEQRRDSNPADTDAKKQLGILLQLKSALSVQTLPADSLAVIQEKLTTFTNKELERLNSKKDSGKAKESKSSSLPPNIPVSPASTLPSIPSGPAATQFPRSPKGNNASLNKTLVTGPASTRKKNRQKQHNKNHFSQQNSQGASNTLNFTPELLQQIQQIASLPSTNQQPLQPQSNFIPPAGQPQPDNNALLSLVMNSLYGNVPQQPAQPNMYLNPQPMASDPTSSYSVLAALQGIASMSTPQPQPYGQPQLQQQPYNLAPYLAKPQPYSVGKPGTSYSGNNSVGNYNKNGNSSNNNGPSNNNQQGSSNNSGGNNLTGLQSLEQSLRSIELSSSSLQTPRKEMIGVLYSDMLRICSTCGKRFPVSAEGKRVRDAHFDWHFRVNKKIRDGNWTQARSWFIQEDEWIKYRDETELDFIVKNTRNRNKELAAASNPNSTSSGSKKSKSKKKKKNNNNSDKQGKTTKDGVTESSNSAVVGSGYNTSSRVSNSGGSSSEVSIPKLSLNGLTTEQLKAKYVLAPSNKQIASLPCPICRDKFSTSFYEDTEEWVWKNAVEVQGRYFHATCYAEAEKTNGGKFLQQILSSGKSTNSGSGGITSTVSSSAHNPLSTSTGANKLEASNQSAESDAISAAISKLVQQSKGSSASSIPTGPRAETAQNVPATISGIEGFDLSAILESVKRKREETDDGNTNNNSPTIKREKI